MAEYLVCGCKVSAGDYICRGHELLGEVAIFLQDLSTGEGEIDRIREYAGELLRQLDVILPQGDSAR